MSEVERDERVLSREELDAIYFPDAPEKMGTRKVPFTRELYIERSDFMKDPPKKFFRLGPGREVRLRWAFFVKCVDVVRGWDFYLRFADADYRALVTKPRPPAVKPAE